MKTRILYAAQILLLSGLFLIFPGNKMGNASEFPSRPVEIIISFAPGGTLDLAVRVMTEELSKTLGVPVIVTNRAGGGGAVGTEYVARAKADGYTILAVPIAFVILRLLNPDVHYKFSDFTPLCKYADSPNIIQVRKDSPFKSFEDLISYAKKNPGKLNCGTAGSGTGGHLSLEIIKTQAGIDFAYLHYKSGGEVITGLLGGHVDFAINALSATMGLMKSGDVRALVSTFGRKITGFPNIPSIAELGYPMATTGSWTGFVLPQGTPNPVVDKLASAFEKTIKNPTVKKNLEDSGQMVDYQDGPTFGKFITEEYKRYEDVAKKAKLIK